MSAEERIEVAIDDAVAAKRERDAERERERAAQEAENRQRASRAAASVGITVPPSAWQPYVDSHYAATMSSGWVPLPFGRNLTLAWSIHSESSYADHSRAAHRLDYVDIDLMPDPTMLPWWEVGISSRASTKHVERLRSKADLGDYIVKTWPGLAGITATITGAPVNETGDRIVADIPGWNTLVAKARAELEALDAMQGIVLPDPPPAPKPEPHSWLPLIATWAIAAVLVILLALGLALW